MKIRYLFILKLEHFLKDNRKEAWLKRPFKNSKTKVLKTNCSLMKVKSIAKCSLGAFCNTFDLH